MLGPSIGVGTGGGGQRGPSLGSMYIKYSEFILDTHTPNLVYIPTLLPRL